MIGSTELKANHRIAQQFIFLQENEKYSKLTKLLEKEMDGSKILVFCETKRGCDGVIMLNYYYTQNVSVGRPCETSEAILLLQQGWLLK